jgi:hypothetical protein
MSTLTPDVFVAISSALTGVSAGQLSPAIDPIGISGQYLAALTANVAAPTLASLVTTFQAAGDPVKGAAALLADPVLGPVARSIMKLWLLGVWYAPANPTQAVNVVSSQAYKESLVWKVMQSHPMGYSMFTYGYWAKQPPALVQFIQPAQS